MPRKKVSDEQILKAIDSLCEMNEKDWLHRFGQASGYPVMFRRERIQNEAQRLFDFTMSDSGFRSRLKKLVSKGVLTVDRLDKYIPFYSKV